MGMVKINGPQALPLRPAGYEKFGTATNNICEAGMMYHSAHPSDFGQRIPTAVRESTRALKTEKVIGQNVTADLHTHYAAVHNARIASRPRTSAEERARREKVIARRKLKKASKKICKQLGIKYQ